MHARQSNRTERIGDIHTETADAPAAHSIPITISSIGQQCKIGVPLFVRTEDFLPDSAAGPSLTAIARFGRFYEGQNAAPAGRVIAIAVHAENGINLAVQVSQRAPFVAPMITKSSRASVRVMRPHTA